MTTTSNNCYLVFSTYVEVILRTLWRFLPLPRILHVCGGDPFGWVDPEHIYTYSPRMWR